MVKRKKWKLVLLVVGIIILTIAFWILFAGKKYTFFMRHGEVGEIKTIVVHLFGNEEEKYNQEYFIDNAESVQKFEKLLKTIKFHPHWTMRQTEGRQVYEEYWDIELMDASGRYVSILDLNAVGNREFVSLGIFYEGGRGSDYSGNGFGILHNSRRERKNSGNADGNDPE